VHRGQRRRVAVYRQHLQPAAGEEARVPPAAGGQIEHRAPGPQQRREAHHPRRRLSAHRASVLQQPAVGEVARVAAVASHRLAKDSRRDAGPRKKAPGDQETRLVTKKLAWSPKNSPGHQTNRLVTKKLAWPPGEAPGHQKTRLVTRRTAW
jgi:hypothetical protein